MLIIIIYWASLMELCDVSCSSELSPSCCQAKRDENGHPHGVQPPHRPMIMIGPTKTRGSLTRPFTNLLTCKRSATWDPPSKVRKGIMESVGEYLLTPLATSTPSSSHAHPHAVAPHPRLALRLDSYSDSLHPVLNNRGKHCRVTVDLVVGDIPIMLTAGTLGQDQ